MTCLPTRKPILQCKLGHYKVCYFLYQVDFLPLIRPLAAISPLTFELYLLAFMSTCHFQNTTRMAQLVIFQTSSMLPPRDTRLTQTLQNPSFLHEDSPFIFLLFSLSDRGEPWSLGIGRPTPLNSMKQLQEDTDLYPFTLVRL